MSGPSTRSPGPPRMDRRLRLAALCVTLGLLVEAASFLAVHPAAFFAFLVPGALLVVAGVAIYLWSLATGVEFSS